MRGGTDGQIQTKSACWEAKTNRQINIVDGYKVNEKNEFHFQAQRMMMMKQKGEQRAR